MDAEAFCQPAEVLAGRSVERLGFPHLAVVGTEIVGRLGGRDQLRAGCRGSLDEFGRLLDAAVTVGGGGDLDGCGEEAFRR